MKKNELEMKATLSCELTPGENGKTGAEIKMMGSLGALLEAYEQVSVALINAIHEAIGEDAARGVYATAQTNILRKTKMKDHFEKFEADHAEEINDIVKKEEKKAKSEIKELLSELLDELDGDDEDA